MKENNLPELLPCPFCGSDGDEVALYNELDGSGQFVRCHVCHVETARYDADAEAIAAWNKRADTSAIAADRAKREGMRLTDDLLKDLEFAVALAGRTYPDRAEAISKRLAEYRALLANAPQVPTSSADYQQQRGAYADIVDEAISSYEQWLLEDDYDVHGFLKKMIERMRGRRALYAAAPQPEQKE